MTKSFYAFGLIVTLLINIPSVQAQVQNGQLDVHGLSEANPRISLEGEWGFCPWVAEPGHLNQPPYQLIKTPGYWPLGDGLRQFGYGIYHLRVTRCSYSQLSLKLGLISTAYRVWINDQPIVQSGQPSTNLEAFEPDYGPRLVSFAVPNEDFDLYIQVTNFTHRKGGIMAPIYLGLPSNIQQLRETSLIENVLLIAIIVALAIYFLAVYSVDRQQRNFLWFGLFCLITATRLATINEVPLKVLWPDTPFSLMNSFRYIGFFLASGLIGLYQNSIFDTPFVRRFTRIIFKISVGASVLILITPFWVDSYISLAFQVVVVAGITLLYYQFFQYRHHADPLLMMLMAGFAAIVIAFGHDILVANGLVRFVYWQSYGFTAYAIVQAVYFGFRYRTLNEQIRSLNNNLTEYSLISRKKDEFEQKMLQQLAILEKREEHQTADSIKHVIQQLHQKPSMPVGHQVTLDNLEKINDEFIFRLKKRHPNLTPAEQELCICLKAKLSNREIASLRNISPDSVKKAKGRLRKKINLDASEDLFAKLNTV